MNSPISWNKYFMELAKLSAQRSKDPKTQVGACIVDSENHIVSIGYNGLPTGMLDYDPLDDEKRSKYWDDEKKHFYVVHAEANAILNTNRDLRGCDIYVTMFPCCECAKLIAQKGIKKVIYLDPKFKKKETGQAALEIFGALGIETQYWRDE